MTSTLTIHRDAPIGTVSPRLYGHFAEHLGRCCYDGLWVGPDSPIPNIQGFRIDVVEALRAMPTPMLRWPGGCYADHYHWRDGIGANRPTRLGLSCGRKVLDDNTLGTHEFLEFCDLIGAEPYLAGNMGSGSVQELCDWVEYCNAAIPTTLVNERVENGRSDAWNVKLWGVGNENWGCGGNYEPESYALEYRRYASMMRHVDPAIEMVVCGHTTEWNRRCLESLRSHLDTVDHFSIHRYWVHGGHGTEFSDADYYALLREAEQTEEFILETLALIEAVNPNARKIGIALDEWGVWHTEARTWGPGAAATEVTDYTQSGTMRDAVATAIGLEVFHRQCNSLSLANLAQIVNVLHAPLMTDGGQFWRTPTYHVLQQHGVHIGATALRTEVQPDHLLPDGTLAISATATTGGLTLVNRHISESIRVRVPAGFNVGTSLFAVSSRDENSATNPNRVAPVKVAVTNRELELPPCSVTTLIAD